MMVSTLCRRLDLLFKNAARAVTKDQTTLSLLQLGILYFLNLGLLMFIIFVVYTNKWLSPLYFATSGIFSPTLVASLGLFGIILLICGRGLFHHKFSSMGYNLISFQKGLLHLIALYMLINLVLLLLNLAFQHAVWYPYWIENGFLVALGALFAQIFGNVLFEETLFRGLFAPQFILHSQKWFPNRPVLGIIVGISIPNLMFAFMHIPIRIYAGMGGFDIFLNLFVLFGIGWGFTLVYLLSENIFTSMAVHILWNISFTLFYPIFPYQIILIVVVIALFVYRLKKVDLSHSNDLIQDDSE